MGEIGVKLNNMTAAERDPHAKGTGTGTGTYRRKWRGRRRQTHGVKYRKITYGPTGEREECRVLKMALLRNVD